MSIKRIVLFASLLLTPMLVVSADYIGSNQSHIVLVNSYNKYGSGDVIFRLSAPIEECYGYWINKGEPGFEANLSMIIAAYQAKSPVVVYGLPAQSERWQGSSAHWCKLYAISYR